MRLQRSLILVMLALSLLPLLTCGVPNESELQTRAAEVGQTAVAQGIEIA
jgi:hypothetical protein